MPNLYRWTQPHGHGSKGPAKVKIWRAGVICFFNLVTVVHTFIMLL